MKSKKTLWLLTVGVATWVVAAATGQLIVLISGTPASSALLNGFIVPFMLVFGALIAKSKFNITIAFTVYGALATFTLLLGPPGVQKIPVAFIAGILTDLAFLLFYKILKIRKSWSYCFAFSIWGGLLAVLARILYEVMELPGKEKFLELFVVMVVIFVIEAAIASFFAVKIYEKRKMDEHPLVKRLNTNEE